MFQDKTPVPDSTLFLKYNWNLLKRKNTDLVSIFFLDTAFFFAKHAHEACRLSSPSRRCG